MKIKNWIKKASVISMALIMVVGLASCGSSDSGSKSSDATETYTAGLEATFAPFDTTDEDGNIVGFDVDLLNAIGEDQGFKVEWKSLGFDGLIPALKSDNIDIVASGMWANDERKKEVDFSDTYYNSGLVLAVKEDSEVTDVNSLPKDAVVAAQIGTSGADYVKQLKEDGKIKEAKIYDKVTDAIMDLQNGTVDGLINDKPVTQEYISKNEGKIKIVGENLTDEGFGIAVKKGNTELLDKINAGLKNVKEDGTYDELLEKWGLK